MKLLYFKVSTFLSRKNQEFLIQKIEKKLFDALGSIKKSYLSSSVTMKKKAFQEISDQISFSLIHYYFDQDLQNYLLDIAVFVNQYDFAKEKQTLPPILLRKKFLKA